MDEKSCHPSLSSEKHPSTTTTTTPTKEDEQMMKTEDLEEAMASSITDASNDALQQQSASRLEASAIVDVPPDDISASLDKRQASLMRHPHPDLHPRRKREEPNVAAAKPERMEKEVKKILDDDSQNVLEEVLTQRAAFSSLPQPEPLPTDTPRRPREPSQPGAVAVPGISAASSPRRPPTEEGEQSSQGMAGDPMPGSMIVGTSNTATALKDRNLSVAEPIEDDETSRELQLASEVDHLASKKREEETNRFRGRVVFSGIFFLLGFSIAAIILAIFLSPSAQSNDDNEQFISLPTSHAPTSQPFESYVLNSLPDETVAVILEDPGSPQSLAFDWILEEEEYFQEQGTTTKERLLQRYSLATLFMATNGDRWENNAGWLDHTVDECEWYTRPDFAMRNQMAPIFPGYLKGFLPSSSSSEESQQHHHQPCDPSGSFRHLWLDQNNLQGTIPQELYLLTSLRTISLSFNELEGTIATNIGQLRDLEGLSLFGQQNGGQNRIPSEIGLLTNLQILMLRDNNHHGDIPTELWLLSDLDTLLLVNNKKLRGTISSEIGNFKKLRWLILENCDFSGSLPTEIGLAKSLEWSITIQNGLTGTLPTQLGDLHRLSILSVLENKLGGTIPTEVGLLSALGTLAFYNNQFNGTVPSELGLLLNLSFAMTFDNNQLTGTLPSQLGKLTRLSKLSFLNNRISGTIPRELGDLTLLERLSFGNNSMTGTIPTDLSALSDSLYTLDLREISGLSGRVPSSLCHLNGTCSTGGGTSRCHDQLGLVFDCTGHFCGCSCPCANITSS